MKAPPASPGQAGTHQHCRDEEADTVREERQPPCQGEQVAPASRADELLAGPFDRHQAPVCHRELVRIGRELRDGRLHSEGEGDIAGRQDDRDQIGHDQICRTESHGGDKGHQSGAGHQVATHHQAAPVHPVGYETSRQRRNRSGGSICGSCTGDEKGIACKGHGQ